MKEKYTAFLHMYSVKARWAILFEKQFMRQ